MVAAETGWERNKRIVFDDIVNNYEKIRPEYPSALFEDIFAYSNLKHIQNVLEIGAGTGKATVAFLNANYDVTAVEISQNMAGFLLNKFHNYENFRVTVTSFEDAVLQEDSFDLIYAASAFHWVDAEIGLPKAMRLLRNDGVIALFRYNAIAADGEALYDEIQTFYENYYYSFYTSSARPVKKSKEDFKKSSEVYISYRFEDLLTYGFKDVAMKFYDGEKTFTADEYIALLDTMSDHISLPENNRLALYEEIKNCILRHGGYHTVRYIFQLYMGRKL